MAKFCNYCGAICEDSMKVCPQCHKAFSGPLVSEAAGKTPLVSSGRGHFFKNNKGKIIIAGIMIVMIAVVAVLMIKFGSLNGKWVSVSNLETQQMIIIDDTSISFGSKKDGESDWSFEDSEYGQILSRDGERLVFQTAEYKQKTFWYRVKNNKLYLYATLDDYESDDPYTVFTRK